MCVCVVSSAGGSDVSEVAPSVLVTSGPHQPLRTCVQQTSCCVFSFLFATCIQEILAALDQCLTLRLLLILPVHVCLPLSLLQICPPSFHFLPDRDEAAPLSSAVDELMVRVSTGGQKTQTHTRMSKHNIPTFIKRTRKTSEMFPAC